MIPFIDLGEDIDKFLSVCIILEDGATFISPGSNVVHGAIEFDA